MKLIRDLMYFSKKNLYQLADINAHTLWKNTTRLHGDKYLNSQYLPIDVAREVLKKYFKDKYIPKEKVQTFFNFKGGTGKTSLTFNLSHFFYLLGFKVLVIDCDPQCHLTRTLSDDPGHDLPSLYEIFNGTSSFNKVVKNILPDFDFIPSSIRLSFVDTLLSHEVGREKKLQKILGPISEKYDFIFIDVNPSISILNRNAIIASDVVNIVCEAQPYSFYGMETLLQEFAQLGEFTKSKAVNFNVILNKVELQIKTHMEIATALQRNNEISSRLCDSVIKKSEDFNIAAKEHTPVIFLRGRQRSSSKEDIINLGKELLLKSTSKIEDNQSEVINAA